MEESAYAEWFGQLRDVMYDVDDIIDFARFKGSLLLPDHHRSSSSRKKVVQASRELVDLVLKQHGNGKKAYKIAIVGTGGVGKTTLAQKIFNSKKIKEQRFNKVAWVCVSRDYSEESLLREVLKQMNVALEQYESVATLKGKLKSATEGKSFFLVLDDVWKSDTWTHLLKGPLYTASTGIVIVTTRQDTVSLEIGADHTHRVDLMEVEEGWELLWKSLNIDEEKKVRHLRDIGIDIVRGCGGLPLAITAIARVLASKGEEENEWRRILSKIESPVNNLPIEITEDATIFRDDLIRMWVAEGFINGQEYQLLEDTAEDYYYELIHRNLLQLYDSSVDNSRCKMHDLLRKLACYLSREELFVGDPKKLGSNTICKVRRISVVSCEDMVSLPSMDQEQYKVRTLKASNWESWRVDEVLFKRLTYLRVLDLTGSIVQSIPSYISNLIHLRLLDLDGTGISCLPESIGVLQNLQILNLQRCRSLHNLPLATTKLCNLRRLGLDGTPITKVPVGVGRLEFLNDLEGFPIGGKSDSTTTQDGWNLEELEHLSQLRMLQMIKLERASPRISTSSLLTDKQYLKVLRLDCSEQTDEAYSEKYICNIEKIFEHLTPPRNLEGLSIMGFFGRRYPSWLGSAINNLSSLKYMFLVDCKSCNHLPPVGQLPSLKVLRVQGATNVTKIGTEILSCCVSNLTPKETVAFPKLEMLAIKDMPNWEEWSFVEGDEQLPTMQQLMPCLKDVKISRCPKLRGLPRQLGHVATSLQSLAIKGSNCLKTVDDFPFLSTAFVIDECEGLERVSNLPQVRGLYLYDCPNLKCVEEVGNFELLWLDACMQDNPGGWVNELVEQGRQRLGDDLDVYMYPS
ncbi:hypothetical protein GUJ93_ZPchr0011g27687 [Zizania palustris]|uniref:NB-ARC domain-containing protein n=1 Tax=Zizania palustris TaxID=103762 RepID=A0A8J5WKZ3_ZIZPA|nr:hypothetical protein GUJ93_ZPchr0011g27687 [Zizania palustris]